MYGKVFARVERKLTFIIIYICIFFFEIVGFACGCGKMKVYDDYKNLIWFWKNNNKLFNLLFDSNLLFVEFFENPGSLHHVFDFQKLLFEDFSGGDIGGEKFPLDLENCDMNIVGSRQHPIIAGLPEQHLIRSVSYRERELMPKSSLIWSGALCEQQYGLWSCFRKDTVFGGSSVVRYKDRFIGDIFIAAADLIVLW